MSCEICGRSNCTRSFHSFEEQSSFDNIADSIKERAVKIIKSNVSRLDGIYFEDEYYVKLDEVLKEIDSYY